MNKKSERAETAWRALLAEHFDRLLALLAPETHNDGFEIVVQGDSEFYRVNALGELSKDTLFSVSVMDTSLELWKWKIVRDSDSSDGEESVSGMRSQIAVMNLDLYRHKAPKSLPRNCFALAAVVLAKGPQGRPDDDVYGWKIAFLRGLQNLSDLPAVDLAGVLAFVDILLPISNATLQNGYRRSAERVLLAAASKRSTAETHMPAVFRAQGIFE